MNVFELSEMLAKDPEEALSAELPSFVELFGFGALFLGLGALFLWFLFGFFWHDERKWKFSLPMNLGLIGFLVFAAILIFSEFLALSICGMPAKGDKEAEHFFALVSAMIKIIGVVGAVAFLLGKQPSLRPTMAPRMPRLRDGMLPINFGGWVLMMLGLSITSMATMLALEEYSVFKQQDVAENYLTPTQWNVAAAVLGAAIAAPLIEEFAFRAMLFGGLRDKMGFWYAGLISSFVFLMVHNPSGNVLYILPIFGLGMCLAWIYEATRNIWYPMLFHAAHNSLTLYNMGLFE